LSIWTLFPHPQNNIFWAFAEDDRQWVNIKKKDGIRCPAGLAMTAERFVSMNRNVMPVLVTGIHVFLVLRFSYVLKYIFSFLNNFFFKNVAKT
jgi:hypothetical protein